MSVETQRAPRLFPLARPAGLEPWLLGALMLGGAALRFSTLDLQSFWHDEAVTVGRVLAPGLGATLGHVPSSEATPPLYYALAWLWTKVFGSGEVGIRSLSALFGTATIPVAWWAGRALVSRAAGLGAAALVAVSPYMVWYSQEARAYALLVLLCAASLGFFAEAMRRQGGRSLGWWAVVSALALLTHYFAIFVVAPEAAILLWLLPERRRAVAAATAGVAVVGAALIPLAVHQADRGHDGWIAQISLGTRIKDTGRQFLLGYSGSPSRALSVVVALLALGAGGLALRHALRSRDRGWWLVLAIAVAALALPLAAKAVGADYVFHRNLIGAWAPLALVVGTAAAVPRFGPLALAGLCAALLALTIAVDVDTKLQRADWRSVARAIGGAPQPRAVVAPSIGDDPLAYYLPGRTTIERGRASPRVSEIYVVGFTAAPRSAARRVPAGFVRGGRTRVGAFTIVAYVAAAPRVVARARLAEARLGMGHAAVLVQAR